MYNIEKTHYDFKLTFGDFMKADEMQKWVADSKKVLENISGEFGVFVDMRTLKPLPQDAQKFMQEGQVIYKQKGMSRSVVILDNAITMLQFKRIAQQTGIYEWERYFDASASPNWEEKAVKWITHKIDPDK